MKLKQMIAFMCLGIMMCTTTFANTTTISEQSINYSDEIDDLFSKLSRNNLHKNHVASMPKSQLASNIDLEKIEDENRTIEDELEKLGVVELTLEEVNEQFNLPEGYDIDIDKPDNYNDVRWFKEPVYTDTINGEVYESVTLRAVSSGVGPLYVNEIEVNHLEDYPFEIGRKNFIEYMVNKGIVTYLGEFTNDIPFIGHAIQVYDVVKSVFSGVSRTTVLEDFNEATLSSTDTMVKFVYANKASNSSAKQQLQLVTTAAKAITSWTVDSPIFTDNGAIMKHINGDNKLEVQGDYYEDAEQAAIEFYAYNYATEYDYVEVDIEVFEKRVKSLPSIAPRFPGHLQ